MHAWSPGPTQLVAALAAPDDAGFTATDALPDRCARAAGEHGAQDVAEVPTTSRAQAVRFVVAGTLLLEPVLVALRRLALGLVGLSRASGLARRADSLRHHAVGVLGGPRLARLPLRAAPRAHEQLGCGSGRSARPAGPPGTQRAARVHHEIDGGHERA